MGKIVISARDASFQGCPIVPASLTTLTETLLNLIRDKEKRQ